MPIDPIAAAQEALERAGREWGWLSAEVAACDDRLRELQRAAAAEQGLPYAEPFDLGLQWDRGAPMPQLVTGARTFAAFYLEGEDDGIGVVEFVSPLALKIGPPTDESLHGHPLSGYRLALYSAHRVHNSAWVRELIDMDRVHYAFREDDWPHRKHFLFTFHDETLDCIANEARAQRRPGSMREVVLQLAAESLC